MTVLNVKQLCVEAGKDRRSLLDGVSCEVKRGEILSVIGPNGAGKSTLLKCIAGDMDSAAGSIDCPALAMSGAQRAQQMAVLPQFSLLNFPYRVDEVVLLGRIPHSTGQSIDRRVVQQCLAAMDISELSKRRYTTLSGGEKQRVQLARVIAQIWHNDQQPSKDNTGSAVRLLLLDEPTTALDLGHQQILMQALHQLTHQGVAIVMVLHDINLAARYSDKVLALRNAKVMAYGSPRTVLNAETVEALFDTQVTVLNRPGDDVPVIVNV